MCPICLVTSLDEHNRACVPCGHSFCKGCILEVLRTSSQGLAKCPYCRESVTLFDVVCCGNALVERPTTIMGNVYIQGNQRGLASYHFEEGESYISYSTAPPFWRLDDGTSPPERKPFENASYDPATRTFKATVNWRPVTFHNDSRWEYRIVFSQDFMTISGGEVTSYQGEGNLSAIHKYRQQLFYVLDLDTLNVASVL